jgi:hypothetical protein
VSLGGFIQKDDQFVSVGQKLGLATDWTVPIIPIVGVRYTAEFGLGAEFEVEDDLFPDAQLNGCYWQAVSGSFFGIELAELEVPIEFALFGNLDDPESLGGVKMRFRIADDDYDTMRENLRCDQPGIVEGVLCAMVDLAGEDLGAWMQIMPEGLYVGLGAYPEVQGTALYFPLLPTGDMGLPGFVDVAGWGPFSEGEFDLCAKDMCGTIDAPPAGARYYDEPDMEGDDS